MNVADEIELDIEKPAAGGRMLARHNGRVVLVAGAIPGERVHARVERVGKSVVYAEATRVLAASPDRVACDYDWRCGGHVLAHIAYARQLRIKSEIIIDSLRRIGHVTLASEPHVVASPQQGYRMRARLHIRRGHIGFFREGTHEVCDVRATSQLLPSTAAWIAALQDVMRRNRLMGAVSLEMTENVAADQRAVHLGLAAGEAARPYRALADAGPLTGLSAGPEEGGAMDVLSGVPAVVDVLHVRDGDPASALRLRRGARAFFQANRFLLEPLVRHVMSLVSNGPVVDLYAGVGLFGLASAAAGAEQVALVEGDPISGADLEGNAEAFPSRVAVWRTSVEAFLRMQAVDRDAVVIADPPRTGISPIALGLLLEKRPKRIVYVSCDTATFARDTRVALDSGYELGSLVGFDLFPGTAHVELVAAFSRVER